MNGPALYDFAPAAHIALMGLALATGPLAWVWLRQRDMSPAARLRALTLLAMFLTFDLVVFGAFTRLTDSGLGCPDWPGCYGNASPLGAQTQIDAAQASLPSGPVTHGKAWIEMIHRYLATSVGVLIVVLAGASWAEHRRAARVSAGVSPWWPTATLLWVCLQGAFGALTVTMKLNPAVVTAHLLGGVALLALLAAQAQGYGRERNVLAHGLRAGTLAVLALSIAQVALGGWVSTNYAVLACTDFPTCQGSWWPAMEFGQGFALRRELGQTTDGAWLPFAALTAIHYAHRLLAYAVLTAIALLAWRVAVAARRQPWLARWAWALAGVALWQFASGLANVLLGWPMAAALAHTAGAAALIALLVSLLAQAGVARPVPTLPRGAELQPGAAH
jgi:cytochrome c oxidase assembly protein subunit 15